MYLTDSPAVQLLLKEPMWKVLEHRDETHLLMYIDGPAVNQDSTIVANPPLAFQIPAPWDPSDDI